MYELEDDPADYGYDPDEEDDDVLDGFISDDGKHHVTWDWYSSPGQYMEYEAWVCETHNKLYYGGCFK